MNIRRFIIAIFGLVAVISGYEIASAIYISQTTGLLVLSSSNKSAILTVSQAGHESLNVGTGNARVRLKPGAYKVFASNAKTQATKDMQIQKKTTTTASLSFIKTDVQSTQDKKTITSNVFTQLLPYTGPGSEYKVSYVYQFNGTGARAIITITSPTPQGQQDATAWIKGLGFDPANLNLNYVTAAVQ